MYNYRLVDEGKDIISGETEDFMEIYYILDESGAYKVGADIVIQKPLENGEECLTSVIAPEVHKLQLTILEMYASMRRKLNNKESVQ